MKLHGRLKQTLALILAASSVVSATPVFAIDYAGHWAEQAINEWKEKGILNGYEDGSFKPKESITRAEFGKILVQLLGLLVTDGAETFQDIKGDEWYAEYVKLVSAAGYMKGTEGNFRPNAYITREEAAYAIATAYHMTGETDKVFVDQEDVSDWAESSIKALVAAGCIAGYPDGTLKPQGNLTRAEAVSMLDKITAEIINTSGTYSQDVKGNLVVNKDNVILQNMTIHGNLYLAEGIGEGDVELKNVKVLGATIVEGGGTNSVKVFKSELNKIIIHKQLKPVRIVTDEASKVPEVLVVSPAVLEGKLEEVKVLTPEEVKIKAAEIAEVHILEEKAKIVLHEEALVEKLVANASSEIVVEGTLKEAVVNADEVVFYNKPGKIEVVPGVEHPTIIEPSKPESSKPSTPSTPSDDEDHGGSVTPVPVPVTVTEVQVITPPNKTTYIEGEILDLAGLEIKLIKSNGTTEVVSVEDFSNKGLTTTPAQGAELTLEHTVVEITHTASGKKVAQNIVVTEGDKERPVFNYTGETEIEVKVGEAFTAPEVTATDNVDGEVEVKWQIKDAKGQIVENIDTDQVGSYTITYTVVDQAGNEATLIITVNIVPKPIDIQDINILNETTITFSTPVDLTNLVVKWNDEVAEAVVTQDTSGTTVTYKVNHMKQENTLEVSQQGYVVYEGEGIKPEFDWKDSTDTTWYHEDQTIFELSTASQLAGLAQLVNEGNDFSGKTIELVDDIDLLGLEWQPIGGGNKREISGEDDSNVKVFSGTFEGNGHTILNLSIIKLFENDNDKSDIHTHNVGLFGKVVNGSLHNIQLENAIITGKPYDYGKGKSYTGVNVGALIGNGFKKEMTGCSVKNIKLHAQKFVGGLIGHTYMNVTACKASNLTIEGMQDVGGIIGYIGESPLIVSECVVQNLTLMASLAQGGGIIGTNNGASSVVKECRLEGTNVIEDQEELWLSTGGRMGGIIGDAAKGITIENCYVDKDKLTIKISDSANHSRIGWYVGAIITTSSKISKDDVNFIDNQGGDCTFEGNIIPKTLMEETPEEMPQPSVEETKQPEDIQIPQEDLQTPEEMPQPPVEEIQQTEEDVQIPEEDMQQAEETPQTSEENMENSEEAPQVSE